MSRPLNHSTKSTSKTVTAFSKANSKSAGKSTAFKPLKIVVIGAGVMGQHHLRICQQLKEVELVAVVELDEVRAKAAAERYGIVACPTLAELIGKVEVDAAIIAVPSVLHLEIGKQCLKQGIHCLIEKPLAITEAQCLELIHLAEKNKLMLLVGHVERFNAAVQRLCTELQEKNCHIQAIDAKRMGYNLQRALDVDVILDLMMHDLDIILSLVKNPVCDFSINTICHLQADEADFASALIAFGVDDNNNNDKGNSSSNSNHSINKKDGKDNKKHSKEAKKNSNSKTIREKANHDHSDDMKNVDQNFSSSTANRIVASISASRMTHKRTRCLDVLTKSGLYSLDFLTQEIWLHRENNQQEQIAVHKQDALTAEILNFVHSVQTGVALGITGQEALKTLRLVWQLQERGRGLASGRLQENKHESKKVIAKGKKFSVISS